MILSRLSRYLCLQQRASLDSMACGIDSTPEAVEGMLAILESKGRVLRLPAGSACGAACCKCDPAMLMVYEWIGENDDGDKQASQT